MLKILCTADVHIGRRSSRLPAGSDYSAADAWTALVNHAIGQRVDAVLIAGDLIDEQSRFFEASGPIERGVLALKEAGIPVVAVSGNHDYDILHRIAAEVGHDHLVMLGRGGTWQRHTLVDDDGRALLHVDGWSFATSRCPDNPLQSYTLEAPHDGAPVVGLLHCDLNGAEPHYAPVPRAQLEATSHAVWILGHIHAPSLRQAAGSAPSLYTGSLLALDPGERGVHGAWLMQLAADTQPASVKVALSPVRYEVVEVDVDGAASDADVRSRILASVRQALESAVSESAGRLKVLSCRLRVSGRTALHGSMPSLVDRAIDIDLQRDGARVVVEARRFIDTAPAFDLHDLARGRDAAARLAQILIGLDSNTGDAASGSDGGRDVDAGLLQAAERAAADVAERLHYLRLGDAGPPTGDQLRALLRRQAALLLDGIMSQKESA
jgi:DNA repair protein SbcD/Mre11